MVTLTDTDLEMYDVESAEGGNIYHYHGFYKGDDVDTLSTELHALKRLVSTPSISFLGRSPVVNRNVYYVSFSLRGDE